VETIYPLVFEYKNERRRDDIEQFPLSERKRRRKEFKESKLLKKQNGSSAKRSGQPAKKRTKLNGYAEDGFVLDDNEEENLSEGEEQQSEVAELKCFKSPVDESDEEEFDSDASHD